MHVSAHVCIAMSICIINIKCWCACVGEKPKPNTRNLCSIMNV